MNTPTQSLYMHHEREADARNVFGFWIYIMSDCILFASLFVVYAVLHNSTYGGPSVRDIVNLPFVLIETLVLLTSSFSYGLAMLAAHHHRTNTTLLLLGVTVLLGVTFISLEFHEFSQLTAVGIDWTKSAFLSSFFVLIGTHALHVTLGVLWMGNLMLQVIDRGLSFITIRKLTSLGLFWHFLDIIWIFVFTIVYLFGII